ncbi:MAG: TetR/AcrR family transcriptional regulator [Oscillospiraceae bacterium]|nr:TetR/AcrR family transcriptional regulator [Oscillospiraceae bacterium]
MANSFLSLPDERRNSIINAALRVFSQYGYKKSPMNEIAAEAGISKSLLFYYFRNKKELYLYLAEYCAEVNKQEVLKNDCYGKDGFFEVLTAGLKVKVGQMRRCPELAMFEMRGFFENDPELKRDVRALIESYSQFEMQKNMMAFDPSEFIEGLDLEMMYRNIYLAAEGFFWEFLNSGDINPDKLERGYMQLINHWKQIYLRKETSS